MTSTVGLTEVLFLWGAFVVGGVGQQGKAEKAPAPVFPQPVSFDVVLERSTFEAREPIIAHVKLTNLGDQVLPLRVRADGTPLRMALEVARGDAPYAEHSLRLQRSGPEFRNAELRPGESMSGDVLVLLDFGEEYVFPSPGEYRLRWNFYPGSGFALIYGNEARVSVLRSSRVNEECLAQLELIALRYHGGDDADTLDLNASEAEKGLDREGILLLGQIISQPGPHLVRPEETPEFQREVELVNSIEKLFERYPNSVYSPYLARYVGLAYAGTLRHERSRIGKGMWDSETIRARPSYAEALRYLTIAKDPQIWPRTTAPENLAQLHIVAQEWDKAEACIATLRERYADIGGVTLAGKLSAEIQTRRQMLEARRAKEYPGP